MFLELMFLELMFLELIFSLDAFLSPRNGMPMNMYEIIKKL